MGSTIQYRGYIGTVEFSEKKMMFHGRVAEIKEKVVYEGKCAEELVDQFHMAVDEYVYEREKAGKPVKPIYRGTFNIRISPQLHERLATYAIRHGMTMNRCIEQILERSPEANEKSEI